MEWSEIKPLPESKALLLVREYFSSHFLRCEYIDPRHLSGGIKSPDYKIFQAEEHLAYCEVKTPENQVNQQAGMYFWDTGFNKLRKFIHKAVKQFHDEDSNHSKPWIVVFTSNHPQLNYSSLLHCIRGSVVLGGTLIKDFRNKRFIKSSNKDLKSVDLFIWMQISYVSPKIYQVKFFLNDNSPFLFEVKRISEFLMPTIDDKIYS